MLQWRRKCLRTKETSTHTNVKDHIDHIESYKATLPSLSLAAAILSWQALTKSTNGQFGEHDMHAIPVAANIGHK
jgi:hypothetical protein